MENIPQKSIAEQVKAELSVVYKEFHNTERPIDELMGHIVEYSNKMKEKYPDAYHRTRAYHALIGSTMFPEETPIEDFEGEDSVLVFVKNLRKKLANPNTL